MPDYPVVDDAGTGYLLGGHRWPVGPFLSAMSFHAPEGLAAVRDGSGAWHLNLQGDPAYAARFLETCGFYEGIAVVRDVRGWFHIGPDGAPLHDRRFRWSGNFQGDRCVVRDTRGFFHITREGNDAYPERYRYAGDFRGGLAVVFSTEGAFHIQPDGGRLGPDTWTHAEPFHKGYAVVADTKGFFHVNRVGRPVGTARFRSAEPFYNGVALCRENEGGLLRLRTNGTWTRVAAELAPITIDRIRHHILAGHRVGLFLRHAERHPIDAETPNWGNDVLLTKAGRIDAARLGAALAPDISVGLWSSPVQRCRQTCRAFADGAGCHGNEVHDHAFLGAPGIYLDGSGEHVEPMRKDYHAFTTGYVDDGVAAGMRPVPAASEELLAFLLGSMTEAACTLFITHDLFAAVLMSYLGLKAPDRTDWCDYLEGVCLIRADAGVEVRRFLMPRRAESC